MSDYTKTYDGAAKDTAQSVLAGVDFDTEFNSISTAIASKLDQTGEALLDSSGNKILDFGETASAVNWLKATNQATGVPAILSAEGEANLGFDLHDSNGNELLVTEAVASAVNYLATVSSATGNDLVIKAVGDDTNIDIDLQSKGSGVVRVNGTEVGTGGSGTFNGCLVVDNSASETLTDATAKIIDFDTELYDTDGWHEGVTNPERLTVPSGVNYVVLTARAVIASGGSSPIDTILSISKNGSDNYGGRTKASWYVDTSTNDIEVMVVSTPIAVSATDYFYLNVKQTSTASKTLRHSVSGYHTWFSIQAVG